jgi:hypothetical protein
MSGCLKETAEDERRHSRRVWGFALGVLGMMLFLVGYLVIRDDGPPDEAGMLPVFTQGGGVDNPLAKFTVECMKHPVFETDVRPVLDMHFGTESAMREHVEKNKELVQAWQRLMASDEKSWRWPVVDLNGKFDLSMPYVAQCMAVVRAARMEAVLLAREGKVGEAVELATEVSRYGTGLLQAEGMLMHCLVGMSLKYSADASLKNVLYRSGDDARVLKEAQLKLEGLDLSLSVFGFALQAEYLAFKSSLAKIEDANWFVNFETSEQVALQYFLRPNRTMRGYINMIKPWIEATNHGGVRLLRVSEEQAAAHLEWRQHERRLWLSPNAGGNLLLKDVTAPPEMSLRAIRLLVNHRLVLTMLALRRFELDQGRLPERLEELVPNYLKEVPLDEFSGKPLIWNRDKLRLYSVSENGVDDGGSFTERRKSDELDFGDAYWWGEEGRRWEDERFKPEESEVEKK